MALDLRAELEGARAAAEGEIGGAASLGELEAARVKYLGGKGEVSQRMRLLGSLPPEERPAAGAQINALKNAITGMFEARRAELAAEEVRRRLREEAVDVTRPGRAPEVG